MPEPSQYVFTHKEIVEMLVRKAGLTGGRWQLMITFGFNAGNVGPDEKSLNPVAFTVVNSIGIQKAPDAGEASPTNSITVDAGELSKE